ncbi:MAG: hypothetical protein GY868_08065, partial [Deltaproteobacteria bacterium]|nr:hypothetical protein [Deltaproteobacteria bacterium]
AAGDDFTAALKTDSNAVARNLAGPDGLFTKILDTLDAVLTGSPESYARHTAGAPEYQGIDLYA